MVHNVYDTQTAQHANKTTTNGARDQPGDAGEKAKISREYVNKLGAGRYDPTLGVLQRLAKALKTTVGELVE
ncbi:MAG: helix-turn-helix transcriptional regulator [Nitrospirae bacterium]|nr:helix-turn-helix transcriptional regulator [Nitrospirota bacterium]MBU6482999.1 helix-turn-helix transcriptional regulator [Nitrospirota bacterium]MDE3038949.1 helix-turn-helix transcriptional regulator [Nitrospirota bacterium]MDE3050483.1 helix-turn-helix transcriptional regulator [Nitrospirota bacterium]MDE3218981.1 helix-turn-helix transcriptional regulator [Nitrospirota bacterium]